VRTTGFYHNKARNIQGLSQKLLTDFGGEVPSTLDELITLPGVGRKLQMWSWDMPLEFRE